MSTTPRMRPENLAAAIQSLPERITEHYPPRPGAPGAPEATAQSVRAWIEGIRQAILGAADQTRALALTMTKSGEDQAREELHREAEVLITLARELWRLGMPQADEESEECEGEL